MKTIIRNCALFAASLLALHTLVAWDDAEKFPGIKPKTDLRPDSTVLLYPGGQAGTKGIIENGVRVTLPPTECNGITEPEILKKSGSLYNTADDARMDIYIPKDCNGQMVIMTPGGGYGHLSTFNEGAYGAAWLYSRGIAVCVLKYRMPDQHPGVPLEDVHNAFRYCRYHARQWGVTQIGVMGGSAGGHLAGCAATMYVDELTKPDFAVLLYPRITVERGVECGTKSRLIGSDDEWAGREEEHEKLLSKYCPHYYVNAKTCPQYICLSADDEQVDARVFIPYYAALIENKVPVELHVFPDGAHGWAFSSEKEKGAGKDKFVMYRPDFYGTLERWLNRQRCNAGASTRGIICPASGNIARKSIGVFGGSLSINHESDASKQRWADALGYDVVSYGVGGAGFSKEQGVSLQEQVEGAGKHDIYILWASTNDCTHGRECGGASDWSEADNYDTAKLSTQCGGINCCIKKLREINPDAVICLFTSLPYFKDGAEGLSAYVKAQIECAEAAGIPVLDQYGLFDKKDVKKYYKADKLHLNEKGYLRICGTQIDFLRSL